VRERQILQVWTIWVALLVLGPVAIMIMTTLYLGSVVKPLANCGICRWRW